MKSNAVFQIGIAIMVATLMIICAASSFAQPPKGGPPMMQSEKAPKGGVGDQSGPGGKGKGGGFMDRFDQNKDGKVTKDEFPGPPNVFTCFDKNGDGAIEESEAPMGPPGGEKGPPPQ